MGNKVSLSSSFNLREMDELSQFISNINMLDGFFMDTTLSISSKCLVIINNLINDENINGVKLMSGLVIPHDDIIISKIEKLKFHCGLIRHLAVVNSSINRVEEIVELNNVNHLTSLTLDHVSIRLVQHIKQHRNTLLKLCVYYSLDNLESLINLCGGDHSFSEKWTNLLHLDVRYNHLRKIGDSVSLLTALSVLDISRNDIDDLSFIQQMPTLVCLNASFNYIRSLPSILNHHLRVLILGYNYLDGVKGIRGFKFLTTLNVSFNMIATNDYLQQIKDMDSVQDLVLRGNPFSYAKNYRLRVLDIVSPRVTAHFALDGVPLTKKENIYLRKRPVIQIAPAPAPLSKVYKEVPIIVANRNEAICDSTAPESQSYANSYARRNIQCQIIANLTESLPNTHEFEDIEPLMRTFPLLKNKREDLFDGLASVLVNNDEMISPRIESVTYSEEPSSPQTPYYVGDKSSNYFIVSVDNGWKSFMHVSVQIIEHKLMIVDEFDVIVDNIDLWRLMAITSDTLHQETNSDKVLKMVFFVSYNNENNGGLSVCTKTVEFTKELELEIFTDQLSLYIHGYTITYDNWSSLPLTNISIKCTQCSSILIPKNNQPRPYSCSNCAGIDFMIENNILVILEPPTLHATLDHEKPQVPLKAAPTLTPVLNRSYHKSSTSNFVIRAIGSTESLFKRNNDKDSEHSDNTSYHTAMNESNIEHSIRSLFSSQGDISDRLVNCPIGNNNENNDANGEGDDDDDDDELRTFNLDKPIDISTLDLAMSSTPYNDDSTESVKRKRRLNLDKPIDTSMLNLDKNIVPHQCYDNDPRGILKSKLTSPWVIHESSCDVNIHMHNHSKIDDRVKLYFLTKVMNDEEDLLAVFKVYLAYRSTITTTSTLAVISNSRLLMFHLLDKISTNMDECIKLANEFKLKSLQQLEYCLNYQWLELQFKNKPTVTLFVGDSDCLKNIGVCITEAASLKTTNLAILHSKDIEQLKSPQILLTMISDVSGEVTMTTISNSESYLVRSSSVLPVTEKTSLEYAAKMMVIEATHIFFIALAYSAKGHQPLFELLHCISLWHVENTIIIDTDDDCNVRLLIKEQGENKTVDIKLMSPRTRSKAVLCIDRMLKDLFRVEILYKMEDISVDGLL